MGSLCHYLGIESCPVARSHTPALLVWLASDAQDLGEWFAQMDTEGVKREQTAWWTRGRNECRRFGVCSLKRQDSRIDKTVQEAGKEGEGEGGSGGTALTWLENIPASRAFCPDGANQV